MPNTLATPPVADKQTLFKEVKYRLSYRGTLELDFICRAALPHIEALTAAELTALRDFLLHKEGDLMGWLVDGLPVPTQHTAAVAQLKNWFAAQRQSNLPKLLN